MRNPESVFVAFTKRSLWLLFINVIHDREIRDTRGFAISTTMFLEERRRSTERHARLRAKSRRQFYVGTSGGWEVSEDCHSGRAECWQEHAHQPARQEIGNYYIIVNFLYISWKELCIICFVNCVSNFCTLHFTYALLSYILYILRLFLYILFNYIIIDLSLW